ncbi:hypothetical protein V6N12_023182 [Hibiscus sabdariffa]|uniref:Uncharacterized protein n=1 Tax=Hibiscus sabdariffa TaxID=183260 RepID=A0ABR2FX22_9ROSI
MAVVFNGEVEEWSSDDHDVRCHRKIMGKLKVTRVVSSGEVQVQQRVKHWASSVILTNSHFQYSEASIRNLAKFQSAKRVPCIKECWQLHFSSEECCGMDQHLKNKTRDILSTHPIQHNEWDVSNLMPIGTNVLPAPQYSQHGRISIWRERKIRGLELVFTNSGRSSSDGYNGIEVKGQSLIHKLERQVNAMLYVPITVPLASLLRSPLAFSLHQLFIFGQSVCVRDVSDGNNDSDSPCLPLGSISSMYSSLW